MRHFVHDSYPTLGLLIDGQWVRAGSRHHRPVLNPASGEVLAQVPLATEDDIGDAIAAAERGFQVWKSVPTFERATVMRTIAHLIRENVERLATILTLEQGKRLTEAREEIRNTADAFEWMGEEGKRAYGRVVPARTADSDQLVRLVPAGPVAAFSPWNFPAVLAARKVATALAAGCSVIIKPAEETPGIMVAIASLCMEAGLPNGVLNVLYGVPSEVSTRLIASPAISKLSFTGSVAVGRQLATQAGAALKKITLELGGHAPVIVMDDVDVDRVVDACIAAKFRNAGQLCICPTRFYVHDAVYDQFTDRLALRAGALRVGSGFDPGVQMGPMANQRRVEAMSHFCEDAVSRGARVVAGGRAPDNGGSGFFWLPTVLADMPDDAAAMVLEPFGPLALVSRFEDLDDALRRANASEFGLAAYAFTNSLRSAHVIEHGLEAGNVSLNTFSLSPPELPFAGIKNSGLGSEMGREGLMEYMNLKSVIRSVA